MKCPFRKITIHKPRSVDGYMVYDAREVEEFGNCYKEECPYYNPAKFPITSCGKMEDIYKEQEQKKEEQ